jgi:hypothetical protein
LPAVLVAGVTAALLGAAPAVASEGPAGPPPLPTGATPVVIPPLPLPPGAAPPQLRLGPVIRRARVVPKRVRRGHRARLRISLSAPARLRVVIRRLSRPHRGRVATLRVPAGGRRLTLRVAGRSHARRLRPGRYRVSIVAVDALGHRSLTVKRRFVVLRAH